MFMTGSSSEVCKSRKSRDSFLRGAMAALTVQHSEQPPDLAAILAESQRLGETPMHASAASLAVDAPAEAPVEELPSSQLLGGRKLYPYQAAGDQIIGDLHRVPRNILCSAPTGAGKSFLILSAITHASKVGAIVCVGEPLVALAKQMHERITSLEYSAALSTGPCRIPARDEAPTALVCTYEVLARMMGNDLPELQRTYAVVLDEFHCIATERGTALQEILHHCGQRAWCVIALSGTVSNANAMATYLTSINGISTRLLCHGRRPIDLQYYYWDETAKATRRFSILRWSSRRTSQLLDAEALNHLVGLKQRQRLFELVRDLQAWDCFPALLVTFSCETLTRCAREAADVFQLLGKTQRSVVTIAFDRLLREIPEEDHVLFADLKRWALSGVFLHHGHLPEAYRSLVTRLAEQRSAPLVFSSSTLSAGINLPVRTVVLCGMRIPERKTDGSMSFDVLSPLLLHQLCGRAGRPGLETTGNVVVVGKGREGYGAASALFARALPAITPWSEVTQGDVLRASVMGRVAGADGSIFADVALARTKRIAERSEALAAQALQCANADALRRVAAARAAHLLLYKAAEPVFGALRQRYGVAAWLSRRSPRGELALGSNGQVPLFEGIGGQAHGSAHGSARGRPMPLDLAALALDVLAASKSLLRLSDDDLLAASIILNSLIDTEVIVPSTTRDLRASLVADGLLSDGDTPTTLGMALTTIRTCSSPGCVLRLLTSTPESPKALLEAASLLLGDGRASGDLARDAELSPRFCDFIAAGLPWRTPLRYRRAVGQWFDGASVAEVCDECGISCGEFSRHIVRTRDLLEEMRVVASTLGMCTEVLSSVLAKIQRGLPFMTYL